jgi:A nuclease of the HNH/ENDO VII superfamily with conserved WHH
VKLRVRITPQNDRMADIAEANRKFGMPPREDWADTFGEAHTWHHDVERGVMQLVPSRLHEQTYPHTGGVKVWYNPNT